MSSIKQIIINAIIKVSGENPALNREGEVSAVEARNDFIRLLMLELFPEESAVVSVPLIEPAVKSPKKVKKSKKEVAPAPVPEPAPEPVKSPKEVKAEAKAAKAAEKEAAKLAKAAAKDESPKKAKAPKKAAKAPEPAPEPVPEPAPEPKAESPKKTKAPKKVKPAEDANLQKIDPTWRKHLKKADKEGAKESEPALLAYLNALTKEEFNAKKAEDHVTDFLAGRAAPAAAVEDDGKVDAELTPVEFEGKDYYVNPETNRVYEGEGVYDEEVGWTNYKPVGYVGMAAFETMKL